MPDGNVTREPSGPSMSNGYALKSQYVVNEGSSDEIVWSNSDRVKYASAVLFDGIIYCFPEGVGSVGMIDTETDTFSTILAVKNAWKNALIMPIRSALISGAMIYLLRDTMLAIFDPSTKTITYFFLYLMISNTQYLHQMAKCT